MSKYTTREQAYYWLVLIEEQTLTSEQSLEFKSWVAIPEHAIAFAEAELMWRALEHESVKAELQTLSVEPPRSALSHCLQYLGSRLERYKFVWFGGVLASVFLVFFIQYQLLQSKPEELQRREVRFTQHYATSVAESREVVLADGSRVLLDADSDINVNYGTSKRYVVLNRGSAFFEVSRDPSRAFVVASGAVEVEVTGTEFDVQRKQNAVYIAVEQGSVSVSQPLPGWSEKNAVSNGQGWSRRKGATMAKIVLGPGQAVKAHRLDGLGEIENVATAFLASWRMGKLVYINRSLGEIVQDMNRYSYSRVAISSEAKNLKLSGTFDVNNIPAMLNVIQAALPVELEQRDNLIRINLR